MEALRLWRERAGISQKTLADEFGVKQATISMWETGECVPAPKNLRKLSQRTGLSYDVLLDNPKRKRA